MAWDVCIPFSLQLAVSLMRLEQGFGNHLRTVQGCRGCVLHPRFVGWSADGDFHASGDAGYDSGGDVV